VRAESVTATLVYTYNASGLRVAQAADGAETTFAWDWATGVPELLDDGSRTYLVGHETLGWDEGAAWQYVLPDALGSVRQAADGTGEVTAARVWTPYGVELGGAQAGLGYAGEWWDAGLEMQYLRARWYDVGVGRFSSKDQWLGLFDLPQSLNRWTYVQNNPLYYQDPSGRTPFSEGDVEKFVRNNDIQFFSIGTTTEDLGFEPWLLKALEQEHVSELLSIMSGRLRPFQNKDIGEFTEGTLSSLYQATHAEATTLLLNSGLCGVTDLELEAAHLSLIVLAGIPASEHYEYRPKTFWPLYPVLMPDGRLIYEPGWDKTGHFFNHAFLTFEYLYCADRDYSEANNLLGTIRVFRTGTEVVANLIGPTPELFPSMEDFVTKPLPAEAGRFP
jgi:RHS repeat-associated protein